MDKDTFISKISELGTIEDEVERRNLLTEISDEIVKVYESVETLNSQITTLNDDILKKDETINKVREDNMQLFLRVQSQKTNQEITKEKTGIEEKQEPVKRKFEDLFKEGDGK